MKTRLQTARLTSFCLGIIICLLSTDWGNAQTVPALVNYQGRLANPDGTVLATGDYTLTFRVYDSATNSGGLVWGPQVFDGVNGQGHGGKIPVVQGYFNVMLGPVDTNGVSLDAAFNATNRYVEIRVGTNNPILPRQQILSAPFAFNAAKLSGADWSAVFGTNDPVNGKIPSTKLATNGTIIAQQIGIGTAAPSVPLHVQRTGGGISAKFEASPGVNTVSLLTHNGGGNFGSKLEFSDDVTASASITSIASGGLRLDTLGTNRVYITGSGNVGIGTGSPQSKLDVNGPINSTALTISGTLNANGVLNANQSIEVGSSGGNGTPAIIDLHYGVNNPGQDYNVRIVNDANNWLSITANSGAATVNVTGVVMANGFPLTSDRNAKTGFQELNFQQVLSTLANLPITKWQYKVTPDEHHIGPMAQDFKAAFGLGADDKHIDLVDSVGVSLAAIQGLNQKLEEKLKEKDAEIETLKINVAKIDLLEQRLNELERRAVSQTERH